MNVEDTPLKTASSRTGLIINRNKNDETHNSEQNEDSDFSALMSSYDQQTGIHHIEYSWTFWQNLDKYFWKSTEAFARFFKIMERNPRKNLFFLVRNPRLWQEIQKIQDLGRKTKTPSTRYFQHLGLRTVSQFLRETPGLKSSLKGDKGALITSRNCR